MEKPKIDQETLNLLKSALLDINHLLKEGFDCNWQTCRMDGVKITVQELAKTIRQQDPDWQLPS